LCVVFLDKKQPKEVGKMREIKKIQLETDYDILKNPAQCTNFEVSVSILKSRVSGFLMKSRSRSRRLRSWLHHCLHQGSPMTT